jgi:hypothetical protein
MISAWKLDQGNLGPKVVGTKQGNSIKGAWLFSNQGNQIRRPWIISAWQLDLGNLGLEAGTNQVK